MKSDRDSAVFGVGNAPLSMGTSMGQGEPGGFAREPEVLQADEGRRSLILRLLPWLVLLGMAGFVALSLRSCGRGDEGQVRVGNMAPEAERSDRVAAATSEAYRKNLARYSEDKARDALESGETFVAPATDVRKAQVPKPVPAPSPREPQAPGPAPQAVKTVQTEQPIRGQGAAASRRLSHERQVDRTAPMRAYLASIKAREPGTQLALVLNTPRPREVPVPVEEKGPASGLPGLKVGDILQAVNRVTLDSDAPGPAMVEVVSGPYRGAKVMGSFQRLNEHLVLRFSELAAADGSVHEIAGFAIDPATDRTAVRTSVDNHVLERWGGLVAASFLEGFGEAVERSGTSAHSTIYGSGWSIPSYSLGEEMWIAAGKAGERAAGLLDRGFARAPTVTIESGTAMGVLLLRLPEGKNQARAGGSRTGRSVSDMAQEIREEQEWVRQHAGRLSGGNAEGGSTGGRAGTGQAHGSRVPAGTLTTIVPHSASRPGW